jgi:hypothetical protein
MSLVYISPAERLLCNRSSFETHHPFLLSDGRRFRSLLLAADTAAQMSNDTTVTDGNGHVYDWADCKRIVNGGPLN